MSREPEQCDYCERDISGEPVTDDDGRGCFCLDECIERFREDEHAEAIDREYERRRDWEQFGVS